jgi:hypothetical protein
MAFASVPAFWRHLAYSWTCLVLGLDPLPLELEPEPDPPNADAPPSRPLSELSG